MQGIRRPEDEGDLIIAELHRQSDERHAPHLRGLPRVLFLDRYTPRRGDGAALERVWQARETANVWRIQVRDVTQERTRTRKNRKVLLNDHALHVLEKARPLTEAHSDYVFAPRETGEKSEMFIPLRDESQTLLVGRAASAVH